MKKLYFMIGTNATGKSSIAKHFIDTDEETFEIPFPDFKTGVQVCPKYNMMIMGRYSKKGTSGGCDTISFKAWQQEMLKQIWDMDQDIFMEGFLIRSRPWVNFLAEFNEGRRELILLLPNTTLETCFKRIEARSGKSREQLKDNGKNVVSCKKMVDSLVNWLGDNRPEFKVVEVDTENSSSEHICNTLLS